MSKPEARLFSIQILWRCVAEVKDFRPTVNLAACKAEISGK
jgi:hypothetical protein